MKGSTASCTLVLMIGHSSPHSFSRCEANRRGTGICGRHKPSNVSLAAESFANPTDDLARFSDAKKRCACQKWLEFIDANKPH